MKKLVTLLSLGTVAAFAHTANVGGGFLSGVMHPLNGFDHFLAMIAVGVLAAVIPNKKAVFSSFIIAMLIAAIVAFNFGFNFIGMENIILASIFVISALVYFAKYLSKYFLVAIIGFFGFTHGFAHGLEFTQGDFTTYVLGFSSMTLALHFTGYAIANYIKSFKLKMA